MGVDIRLEKSETLEAEQIPAGPCSQWGLGRDLPFRKQGDSTEVCSAPVHITDYGIKAKSQAICLVPVFSPNSIIFFPESLFPLQGLFYHACSWKD